MISSSFSFVLAVVVATGVSGCCCRPYVQAVAEPSPSAPIPAPPIPSKPAAVAAPVVEPHGVIAVAGRRRDMGWVDRAADLLQERGIDSMTLLGLGVKLIVNFEDKEAARAILRADPICSHLDIPDEGP